MTLARAPVIGAIALAWLAAIAAELLGSGERLHHDALLSGGLPWWAAGGLFVAAWQLMIAAMMLPSSLPLIRLFDHASSSGSARAAFVGGYALVWSVFGVFAFGGDTVVHAVVHRTPWLEQRSSLIAGATLVVAGLFQFSELKQRCLRECRHPAAFLMKHYRRGTGAALRMGVHHGVFCVGCCWALMLVSFAAGVANLVWMALLTALMVFEKTGKGGERGVAPIGAGLSALGVLVALV